MLVNLTKDELKVIVYYLKGKELMFEGDTIKSIQNKLNPLIAACTCKENSND